jgi:MFS family permease
MSEKFHSSIERRASESTADSELCVIKQREGGRAAWMTVAGSVLVYYSSMGVLNSFGFFNNYYSHDFLKGTPTATIAFIGTLQIALMNSLAAVSGTICDRYGIKVGIGFPESHIRLLTVSQQWLYLGAGSGTAAGLVALSFAHPGQFWHIFVIQGLCVGLSVAFAAQPALIVVGQHFKERRALAMGLATTGASLGGIGFPLMFERLLPILGFSWMLRVAALKVV